MAGGNLSTKVAIVAVYTALAASFSFLLAATVR
jgi:hypothetical protein